MSFPVGSRVVRKPGEAFEGEFGKPYKVLAVKRDWLRLEGLEKHEFGFNAKYFTEYAEPKPVKGHTADGGGLQNHSVGGPYPYIVVAIDNPTGLEPGLYYYVQDKRGDRCTIHTRSASLAVEWAAVHREMNPRGYDGLGIPDIKVSEGYIKPEPTEVTITLAHKDAVTLSWLLAVVGGDAGLSLNKSVRAQFENDRRLCWARCRDTLNTEFWAGGTKGTGGSVFINRK